jgi:DNA mismatch endonuclease (patch repair protein)
MKTYIRDKRSPKPTSSLSSRVMSAIRAKDTKPEIIFRKQLWKNGLRGYRLHWKVEGRPDIAFPGKKIAIFIHGCYWHKCPICDLPTPKSNTAFWQDKFAKNVERDDRKKNVLEKAGWDVLIFWECQIKKDVQPLIETVKFHIR